MQKKLILSILSLSTFFVSLPNPATLIIYSDSGVQGLFEQPKTPFEVLGLQGHSAKGYEVFGFNQMPPNQEFVRAVRSLKAQYHPDRNPKGAEVFKFVVAAEQNPQGDFFRDEALNAQHHRAERDSSLASLGIEQEDIVRTLRVITAGVLICIFWELRNFVVKKRQAAQKKVHPKSV